MKVRVGLGVHRNYINVSAMIGIGLGEITIVFHKQVIILAIKVNNSRNG